LQYPDDVPLYMQIEEVEYGSAYTGTPHWFSAILFEGWAFWTAGPSHHIKNEVLAKVSVMPNVKRVQLVKVYVPFVH
jgi:hypothetical protein